MKLLEKVWKLSWRNFEFCMKATVYLWRLRGLVWIWAFLSWTALKVPAEQRSKLCQTDFQTLWICFTEILQQWTLIFITNIYSLNCFHRKFLFSMNKTCVCICFFSEFPLVLLLYNIGFCNLLLWRQFVTQIYYSSQIICKNSLSNWFASI